MSYKVLTTFREKEHGGHVYEKGKPYPADGYKATKKRVEFLQQKHKEFGVAFLESPKEEPKKEEPEKEAKKKSDAK